MFENTLPKVSFTTVVTAIGMWGYTPVRTTDVLVYIFISYLLSTHADRHAGDISVTVFLFVCLSAGFLVTDISGVG